MGSRSGVSSLMLASEEEFPAQAKSCPPRAPPPWKGGGPESTDGHTATLICRVGYRFGEFRVGKWLGKPRHLELPALGQIRVSGDNDNPQIRIGLEGMVHQFGAAHLRHRVRSEERRVGEEGRCRW